MRNALLFDDIIHFTDFVRVYGADASSSKGFILSHVRDPDRPARDVAGDVLAAGPSVVLVTAGGGSVEILTAVGAPRTIPVPPVEVVDTIGAGDAFGGGFCAWWAMSGHRRGDLADHDLVEAAVRAAITVAGVVCTRRGAVPPTPDELPGPWPTG